jgi:hypothetical protein
MPTCQACFEDVEEELDDEGYCPECGEYFDSEDAQRANEFTQSLEAELCEGDDADPD